MTDGPIWMLQQPLPNVMDVIYIAYICISVFHNVQGWPFYMSQQMQLHNILRVPLWNIVKIPPSKNPQL